MNLLISALKNNNFWLILLSCFQMFAWACSLVMTANELSVMLSRSHQIISYYRFQVNVLTLKLPITIVILIYGLKKDK